MSGWVALLRAVNLGPHNKIPMTELAALGRELGFAGVRTYIASGNLIFASDQREEELRQALEGAIAAQWGKPIGVLMRSGAELAQVAARNPWPDRPGNRVAVLFTDEAPTLEGVRGQAGEVLALGRRELYIDYAEGIGTSKLVVPAAKRGTARNMNTVVKLAELAREIS